MERFGAQLQNIKFLSVLPATRDQPPHFPATINYAPQPAMMSIFNISSLGATPRKSLSTINDPQPSLSFILQRTLAQKTNLHPSITPLHPS
jgi:hypothetical protein